MADVNLCCGLLTASKEPVPLKGISVDIQIKGFVADVSANLTYKNEEQNPPEAIFVFPMDDDSAVYSFEAMVDGTKIVAEIQEKKEAQETYGDAISQGQEAFLLEEDSSSGDIFLCSVGNLPPDQEAEVTLSFVRELPLEPDGAVRFVLPTVLNPRYTPQDVEMKSVTTNIPRVPTEKLPYSLKMTANIMSPYGVNRVQSNCDLTPIDYLKEDKTSAQVSLADDHKFDKDVELLIYFHEVDKPSVLVEAGQPSAESGSLMANVNLMLNFYPNIPESQELSSTGEFIFLIDRSASMGRRLNKELGLPRCIESAKQTMVLLLKSLPHGCYFNIFGFGSNFQSFFRSSVKYTQKSMKSALKQIKKIKANMGGTNILPPLKHIYSKAEKPGHPRQLFVFTDGEVWNTKSVIADVQANSSKHRGFAFGIGQGVSTALIKGIAREGHGTCEFITGKERMQQKVLQTLKCSLQPVVKYVSLKWTLPTGIESVLLSHPPNAIFSGRRSIVYAQLKGEIDQATNAEVYLDYTFKDENVRNPLQFSLHPEEESRLPIHRLAAKNVIRDLETGTDSDDKDVKKKILETSLQSGVICSLTAFIAVNKDLNQPIQGPLTQRYMPPQQLCLREYHLVGEHSDSRHSDMGQITEDCTSGTKKSGEETGHEDPAGSGRPGVGDNSGEVVKAGGQIGSSDAGHEDPAGSGRPGVGDNSGELVKAGGQIGSSDTGHEDPAGSGRPGVGDNSGELVTAGGQIGSSDATPKKSKGGFFGCFGGFTKSKGLKQNKSDEKETDSVFRLISLQNADGSWSLNSDITSALGLTEMELKANTLGKDIDSTVWATVLALICLHSTSIDRRDEWELLEWKALSWVKVKAGSILGGCIMAGNSLLKASVEAKVFGM
ncbi:von Willebrand factor A domain-containing protein 5A-like isoform X2 [Pleurodeles waltl]|uniref:von Willebrand factor A domain-containing protein 5A-like isoform X2 n=1 Tax=Pleurodeles waltl TaxID=8319 RepID=UPI003709B050